MKSIKLNYNDTDYEKLVEALGESGEDIETVVAKIIDNEMKNRALQKALRK